MLSTTQASQSGQRAEAKVFAALATLPAPWQFFHTVEWRNLKGQAEAVGEADAVVFHPQHGLIVFEVKAGAIEIRHGVWYYGSGLAMDQSPFSQARRNRYALIEKLRTRLGRHEVDALTVTHAGWFPEVDWTGVLPGSEMPSRAFLLDRASLAEPEPALLLLFREASRRPVAWTDAQQRVLKELLALDCQYLVPLASRVEDVVGAMHRATQEQVQVLRALRSQPRLLVHGGAGSGKTVLACALAREHAALGKSVLLTCFNTALAQSLAVSLAGVPGITVLAFHELARTQALAGGLAYCVPTEGEAAGRFFKEESAKLLLQAAQGSLTRFDSIIVDEGADFAATWWGALEALGRVGFSWYCFYDLHQSIFQADSQWEPPFAATPILLEANLRNTQAIGEKAARWARCVEPQTYRISGGEPPVILTSPSYAEMAKQLRDLLRNLIGNESVKPEQIAVLSPYRRSNPRSGWLTGLSKFSVSADLATPQPGKLRAGTIQGFKGLEADVVILVGIDSAVSKHPQTLYVGATRARAALYVLALEGALAEVAEES